MLNKKKLIISAIIVILITWFTFLPSLNNDFTNWDDNIHITQNLNIKKISLENIKKICSTSYANMYIPITILSYMIEYHFFQLNPFIYHITNLIIHIINSLLLLYLIFIISNNITISFITSILFAIHPLHVESVAWISERKDLLSTFFFLLALISYTYFLLKKSKKYYFLTLIIIILSLLSKPMALTFPFILILWDFYFQKKCDRNIILNKIPFFILSIIFGIISLHTQTSAIINQKGYNSGDNIFIAFFGILFYLFKLILPVNISCIYPYPEKINHMLPIKIIISPIIVIAIIYITLYTLKYTKKVFFGFLFFLITIIPVIKLIPLGNAMAADRYTYIPSIGLFYIFSEGFYLFYNKFNRRKWIPVISIIIIIIALSFLTSERCKIWNNNIILWSDVINKYPYVSEAYINRGAEYIQRKEYDNAFKDLNMALKINPDLPGIYNNIGNYYYKKENYNKALEYYSKAVTLNPLYVEAYINRSNIYYTKEEYNKAIKDINKAISINSNIPEAYNNLGNIYSKKGQYTEAINEFNKALNKDSNYLEVYNNRGLAYYSIENYNKAMKDFIYVINSKPDYKEAYQNLGNLYYKKGQYNEAIKQYNQVISIEPNFPEAYTGLGNVYMEQGNYLKSLKNFNKAIKINPNFTEAYNGLGILYIIKKDYNRALINFNKATKINPNFIQAYYNRILIYSKLKRHTKVWEDIIFISKSGYKISPEFIKELQKNYQ